MADNLSIDRRTSALLVMDFQTLIVDNYAAGAETLLDRTAKLIAVARTAGIRVIYGSSASAPAIPRSATEMRRSTDSRPRAHSLRGPKMRRSIPPSRRWPRKSSSPSIG
jgi:nicotinamidase-related amidase